MSLTLFSAFFFALQANADVTQTGCDPKLQIQAKTVQAELGDTIIVFAPANPSTGYTWVSKEKIQSVYTDMSRGRAGGGGAFNFAIEATSDLDNKTLTFEYKCAWEKTAPASTCKITVQII